MAIRDTAAIIQDAITFIASKIPNIFTAVGTVVRDLVIESPAQEFSKVYTEIAHTQELQSLEFAADQTTDELNAYGLNFGMTRLLGRTATGSVTFRIRNFSTSSANISVPVGTLVSTTGTDTIPQVGFVTTQALLFQASLAPAYFNPATGYYELTATIIAQSVGSKSNVSAGTINQLVSSITGITSVINSVATTGGEDIETNTEFADRIRLKLSGNNIGTQNGLLSLVRANPSVTDAITVTPNDVEMLRDQFGGAVDIYVIGEQLTSIFDLILYTTTGPQEFVLQHQPASSVSSITGIAGSVPYTFIQGTDYNLVTDPTILYNGSVRLQNKVVFNIGGTNPDNNTTITINYVYNSVIETLQAEIDADDGHIITSDVLVKEGNTAQVDVTADVTLFPGNVPAQAISDIQTAVSTYVNTLGLGDSIDKSDIVAKIEAVTSVDQVNLSTLVLAKNLVPLSPTDQRLVIFKNEYPRIGTITINIV